MTRPIAALLLLTVLGVSFAQDEPIRTVMQTGFEEGLAPFTVSWGDATLAVVGTTGNLWIDLFSERLHVYQNDASCYSWVGYGANLDYGLVDAFCDAVATGKPMPITGHDGLRAMEVALAAYQSAALGEIVPLPL